MMPITLFLSSTLRKYVPGYDPIRGVAVDIDAPMTVAEFCERMNIPADGIKLVMVDGKGETLQYSLKGDERLSLFPAVGGG